MDLMPLTPIQKKLYVTIHSNFKENKVVPTIRELTQIIGYKSIGSTWQMLRVLKEKGYLKIIDFKARGYIPLIDL